MTVLKENLWSTGKLSKDSACGPPSEREENET